MACARLHPRSPRNRGAHVHRRTAQPILTQPHHVGHLALAVWSAPDTRPRLIAGDAPPGAGDAMWCQISAIGGVHTVRVWKLRVTALRSGHAGPCGTTTPPTPFLVIGQVQRERRDRAARYGQTGSSRSAQPSKSFCRRRRSASRASGPAAKRGRQVAEHARVADSGRRCRPPRRPPLETAGVEPGSSGSCGGGRGASEWSPCPPAGPAARWSDARRPSGWKPSGRASCASG